MWSSLWYCNRYLLALLQRSKGSSNRPNQQITLTSWQYPLIDYLGLLTKVSVPLLPQQQSKTFLLWIPIKLLIVIKSQKLIQASWSFWRSSFFLQLWATLGLFLPFYFAGKFSLLNLIQTTEKWCYISQILFEPKPYPNPK